jgi:uridine kinase
MTGNIKKTAIGISGCSGSGKSTLINGLLKRFAPGDISVISQDNYYIPRELQVTDREGVKNFDLPGSIDHRRMVSDLQNLMSGKPVSLEIYRFNNRGSEPARITIPPARIIIIEGIFIFHVHEVDRLLDYRLFIDAREYLMLKRRIIRDREERGYELSDVLYRYENHVIPAFDRYIMPYRDKCDLVITNNTATDQAISALYDFIAHLPGSPEM